ncbi:MAG: hypothetical protein EOP84_01675 [Verrucomicrobiaceae bacterium]|nr:MAG: hypothetical protein EOP84_01675 [Verrucomicrobiaceae bacterium]
MRTIALAIALLSTTAVQAFEPDVKLVCTLDAGFVLNLYMDRDADEVKGRAEGSQTVYVGRVDTTPEAYSVWLQNNVTLEIDRQTGQTDARTSDGTPVRGNCRSAGPL